LKKPAPNAVITAARVTLKWTLATCAQNYKIFVKDTATGQNVVKVNDYAKLKFKTGVLPRPKNYKWFIKACNDLGCSKSIPRFFTLP
jgi:hypothetical protein